jgi:hypothetical protein
MNRFLALDCECGGLGTDKSLLTAYFEVLNYKMEYLDSLHIKLKHDSYVLTAQGMAINKIDIVLHDRYAEYKTTAGQKLYKFLSKYSEEGHTKLIPVGHGVFRDLWWIWEQLLGRKTFEQYVSYRKLDTAVIAQFLKVQGKLPESVSGSLISLASYYDIPLLHTEEDNFHNEIYDTKATIEVLKAQLKS